MTVRITGSSRYAVPGLVASVPGSHVPHHLMGIGNMKCIKGLSDRLLHVNGMYMGSFGKILGLEI